jgi:hypothetical protein
VSLIFVGMDKRIESVLISIKSMLRRKGNS